MAGPIRYAVVATLGDYGCFIIQITEEGTIAEKKADLIKGAKENWVWVHYLWTNIKN